MNWTDERLREHYRQRAEHAAVPLAKAQAAVELPAAKGRLPKGKMNSGEAAYDAFLDLELRVGNILWHRFEAITVKLGPDLRLTPDQLVMYPDGHLEAHDVKGSRTRKKGRKSGQQTYYAEEDAMVKMRALAGNFVIPIFIVFREKNGIWQKVKI